LKLCRFRLFAAYALQGAAFIASGFLALEAEHFVIHIYSPSFFIGSKRGNDNKGMQASMLEKQPKKEL
jgi:hypothetical protein